jgi:chromosomal replication initiation ATPase DnaA
MKPFDELIAIVERSTGVTADELLSKARPNRIAFARWILMTMAMREGYHDSSIGRKLGKDHGTIAHGIASLPKVILEDAEVREWNRQCFQTLDESKIKSA